MFRQSQLGFKASIIFLTIIDISAIVYCNHLQLYSEVIEILLYQWFPRPILPQNIQSAERDVLNKIGRGNPWLSKIFYRLLRLKCENFSPKTSQSGWLFYITVPRDVSNLTSLCNLFGESYIGNVGQKTVKSLFRILITFLCEYICQRLEF